MSEELPQGWEWTSLGDLTNPRKGKVNPAPGDTRPYLSLHGIESDTTRVLDWEAAADYTSQSAQLFPGDTAYARLRPYLNKVARVDQEALGSAELIVLPPTGKLDGRFLAYRLSARDFVEFANAASTGDRPRLKWAQMQSFRLALPPLEEQKRVVAAIEEHVSRLDSARRAVASARRRLEAFQRSAVLSLFDRPDWPWTTLGEIAEVKGGVTKDSKRQHDPDFVEAPYLRVANVQRGFLDLSEVTTIRVARKKVEQLRLVFGDVLFNEGGDRDKLGRGWVWEGQIEDCIHQNHVFRARLLTDDFDPYFVSMHGNTWGQQWFEKHGKQTTNLASINLTTLKAFPVPAPPVIEQRELMSELMVLLRAHERLRSEVDRADAYAESLRRAILAAAFSGRLSSREVEHAASAPESTAEDDRKLEKKRAT